MYFLLSRTLKWAVLLNPPHVFMLTDEISHDYPTEFIDKILNRSWYLYLNWLFLTLMCTNQTEKKIINIVSKCFSTNLHHHFQSQLQILTQCQTWCCAVRYNCTRHFLEFYLTFCDLCCCTSTTLVTVVETSQSYRHKSMFKVPKRKSSIKLHQQQ